MGKNKRGKRINSSNNTAIPHQRVAGGHDEQYNTILPDEAQSTEPIECESPNEELQNEFPTATTTLSIGDTVKIKGLVNASEYNNNASEEVVEDGGIIFCLLTRQWHDAGGRRILQRRHGATFRWGMV